MKPKTRLLLPAATESDWRWREYKAYVAICGDFVDCVVTGGIVNIVSRVAAQPARNPHTATASAYEEVAA